MELVANVLLYGHESVVGGFHENEEVRTAATTTLRAQLRLHFQNVHWVDRKSVV